MKSAIKKILKSYLHEQRIKWTEELLKNVAKNYPTKGDFLKNEPNAYEAAKRRGVDFFNSITSHMVPTQRQVPSGFWTYDNVKNEAQKYKSRNDFQNGSKGAYLKAREMGWLDDITTHMTDSPNKKLNTDSFIEKSRKIHGGKYDYSLVDYVKSIDKVKIICPKHDLIFNIQAQAHLQGQGCPLCGKEISSKKRRSNTQDFISKSKLIHGDKFLYDKTDYKDAKTKVIITCPKEGHGDFLVQPNHHISSKTGCPKCKESSGEKLISDFLLQNNIEFQVQKKYSDCKGIGQKKCRVLPFDFYLPKYNTLIEYDGRQHYEPVYGYEQLSIQKSIDKIKTEYAFNNNINLIRIPFTIKKDGIINLIKKELRL
jgi:hypothetical protein